MPTTLAAANPHLLHSSLLAAPHCFSTRIGGLSRGIFSSLNFGNPGDLPTHERDTPATIAANFARVTAQLGLSNRELVQVHQVHGNVVHIVSAASPAHPTERDTKADALVTSDPSRILVVRVADCTPILLESADSSIVAAVHAGWRGAISSVLPAAVAAMRSLGATTIRAAIGPCISAPNFEVGPEVLAEFDRTFGPASGICTHRPDGKGTVDLKAVLALQLRAANITEIEISPHCTVEREDLFFSHRRDAGRTGRMIALISPRPPRS